MNSNKTIQEDEIDLRELFAVVAQKKVLIAVITSVATFLAVLYAYSLTPIYEVKTNIKIGHIGEELIASPESIVKTLQVVFNVEDKRASKEKVVSEVNSISANKKVPNFIELKAEGVSNDDALAKSKEVLSYLQALDKNKIEHYLHEAKNKIDELNREISRIDAFEIKNIKEQIRVLKEQKITQINEKITRLKTQDIPKIEKMILISKTQDIAKIDEKINRLKTQTIPKVEKNISVLETQDIAKINERISLFMDVELPSLDVKIVYYTEKLNEYKHEILKLNKTITNASNETSAMVSSIQMVNYQNLVLGSQNKIEDLKIQKEHILQETILNLKREKDNIENPEFKS